MILSEVKKVGFRSEQTGLVVFTKIYDFYISLEIKIVWARDDRRWRYCQFLLRGTDGGFRAHSSKKGGIMLSITERSE